jgi:hypothetical protein
MTAAYQKALESVRSLTEDERWQLVDDIVGEDGPLDEVWQREIARRSDEIDRGLVTPVKWSDAKTRMHADD